MSPTRRIARVILETRLPQLDRLFDYEVPPTLEVSLGMRVKVPLRQRKTLATGFVVALLSDTEHQGSLASVSDVVGPVSLMPSELWELAEGIASRQAGSAADVLRLAIPPRYVRAEKKWRESREVSVSVATLPSRPEGGGGYPEQAWERMLEPDARSALYLDHGVSELTSGESVPRGAVTVAEIAHTALSQEKSLVVVVPTWRHVAFYEAALREVVPEESLALLHTDMAPAERYVEYLRCLEERPMVVLGTRHAVYAPAHQLAGIVVVDDTDESHSEPLAPYPHTRDVALLRHKNTRCAVVFASVVHGLSVTRWSEQGYVTPVTPTETFRARVIPTELAAGSAAHQAPARLPSQAFRAAKEALAEGPVLIQVFRAGFSTGLACAECGERGVCGACHGPLRLMARGVQPQCSWCGVPDTAWRCEACQGKNLVPRGQGIGRTVSDIGKAFPTVPVIRSDGENRVLRVLSQPALVIATRGAEPLAEGGYAAAVLLDGAAMLSRESLGALEDSLHAWEGAISLLRPTATAYLADVTGLPALAVTSGRYEQLLRHELMERQNLKLPPAIRIASISGPASLVSKAREALEATGAISDVLGPVETGPGVVRIIIRFSYAQGSRVTGELRALRNKLAVGSAKGRPERLHIVVDDADRLDSLLND